MVGREYKIVRAIRRAFVRRVIAEGMQSSWNLEHLLHGTNEFPRR